MSQTKYSIITILFIQFCIQTTAILIIILNTAVVNFNELPREITLNGVCLSYLKVEIKTQEQWDELLSKEGLIGTV